MGINNFRRKTSLAQLVWNVISSCGPRLIHIMLFPLLRGHDVLTAVQLELKLLVAYFSGDQGISFWISVAIGNLVC